MPRTKPFPQQISFPGMEIIIGNNPIDPILFNCTFLTNREKHLFIKLQECCLVGGQLAATYITNDSLCKLIGYKHNTHASAGVSKLKKLKLIKTRQFETTIKKGTKRQRRTRRCITINENWKLAIIINQINKTTILPYQMFPMSTTVQVLQWICGQTKTLHGSPQNNINNNTSSSNQKLNETAQNIYNWVKTSGVPYVVKDSSYRVTDFCNHYRKVSAGILLLRTNIRNFSKEKSPKQFNNANFEKSNPKPSNQKNKINIHAQTKPKFDFITAVLAHPAFPIKLMGHKKQIAAILDIWVRYRAEIKKPYTTKTQLIPFMAQFRKIKSVKAFRFVVMDAIDRKYILFYADRQKYMDSESTTTAASARVGATIAPKTLTDTQIEAFNLMAKATNLTQYKTKQAGSIIKDLDNVCQWVLGPAFGAKGLEIEREDRIIYVIENIIKWAKQTDWIKSISLNLFDPRGNTFPKWMQYMFDEVGEFDQMMSDEVYEQFNQWKEETE
jgi:hypothetical protein